MLSLHKRISVDASDKRKIITLVEADSSKVLWDSTLNYLAYKSASDEVEFCAIIYAMKNYPNVNLEIISDCNSVVDILNNKGKVSQKRNHFVEKIRELCKNRSVLFKWISRDLNEAGLKQDGYSLDEIRNPDLLKMKKEIRERVREKYFRNKQRQNKERE